MSHQLNEFQVLFPATTTTTLNDHASEIIQSTLNQDDIETKVYHDDDAAVCLMSHKSLSSANLLFRFRRKSECDNTSEYCF